MPEIHLFDFNMIWELAGPIIITAVVILGYAIIAFILLGRMKKGLVKELTRIGIIVGLVAVVLASFQITSYIWSI